MTTSFPLNINLKLNSMRKIKGIEIKDEVSGMCYTTEVTSHLNMVTDSIGIPIEVRFYGERILINLKERHPNNVAKVVFFYDGDFGREPFTCSIPYSDMAHLHRLIYHQFLKDFEHIVRYEIYPKG